MELKEKPNRPTRRRVGSDAQSAHRSPRWVSDRTQNLDPSYRARNFVHPTVWPLSRSVSVDGSVMSLSHKLALVVVLTLAVSGLAPVSTPLLAPSAGALPNPTTSDAVRSAPAGFLPAPNPSPYCDSPTYFDHWPAQSSGPWVTSDDPGNPNALTAERAAVSSQESRCS